jgi:hypothetical protein
MKPIKLNTLLATSIALALLMGLPGCFFSHHDDRGDRDRVQDRERHYSDHHDGDSHDEHHDNDRHDEGR